MEWISVNDDTNKPEEGQGILVWNKDDVETAMFHKGKITNFVEELPKVTHWMPKPKAPEDDIFVTVVDKKSGAI